MLELTLSILALIICFPAILYGQSTQPDQSLSDQIDDIYSEMATAVEEKSAADLASHFASDVFFKLPGQEPVNSRMGVQKIHEEMFKQGMSVRFQTSELQEYDNIALEIGTAEIIAPDGSIVARTTYLTNWKKTDGIWKIYRDVVSALPASE